MSGLLYRGSRAWLSGVAAVALVAALGVAPERAQAQDTAAEDDSGGLTEIVVTAQRREENLRDVPISINAINEESLKNLGIKDTNSLVLAVPSVNFTRSGTSGIFVIRGVSTPNGAIGEEGSTAVYIDDVYMPDLAQTISKFNNIERIEVLNGPQGTLFGRNATGGLIRVITRDPGDSTEINGQIGYANYETISGQAYLSTPLSEKVGWNIAFTGQDQGKGFGFNPTLGKRTKTDDYWSVRSKLVANPTDNLKITLVGDYYRAINDIAVQLFPVSVNTTTRIPTGPLAGLDSPANFPSYTRIRAWGVSGKMELDVGFGSITSITSYRKLKLSTAFDVDSRAINLVNLAIEGESKSFQQELRLASATTDPLSWQIGAFYLHNVAAQNQTQSGLAFGTNTLNIVARGPVDSISLFGEATYAITPTTHLTGGVRWTSDNRKLPLGFTATLNSAGGLVPPATPASPPNPRTNALTEKRYSQVTYRAALRQELSDRVSIYASVNRGFKSGQFNLQSPFDPPVRPVTIMAYEAGLKGDFLDNHLRLSIAGFHYDINDYQVRSSAGTPPVSTLSNAAKVKIDGVDINMEAAITSQFRLTAGMSYLDSRYSDFGNSACSVIAPGSYPLDRSCFNAAGVAIGGNAAGNRTAVAPKFTFNASVNYRVPIGDSGELRFTGGYSHKSQYYFEPDNVLSQPAYDVFSASLEYAPSEHLAVELFMKNIGDERYNVQMVTAAGQSALAAEPRTYGVNLKFKY